MNIKGDFIFFFWESSNFERIWASYTYLARDPNAMGPVQFMWRPSGVTYFVRDP